MRYVVLLIALMLAGAAVPVSGTAASANESFFRDLLGWDVTPDGVATIYSADGAQRVSYATALQRLAARAGAVDLGAAVTGADSGDVTIGDVWILGVGPGSCPQVVGTPTPIPFLPVIPQNWIYGGTYGTLSAQGFGYVLGWTTKTMVTYSSMVDASGLIDEFCVQLGNSHLLFPFLNGVVESR